MPGMRRREFFSLIGGAAVAWPLSARSQQSVMPLVGFLSSTSPGGYQNYLIAFRKGLAELGRTAALGGHVARCENDKCAHMVIVYNSCRNRHCPKCQGAAAKAWL